MGGDKPTLQQVTDLNWWNQQPTEAIAIVMANPETNMGCDNDYFFVNRSRFYETCDVAEGECLNGKHFCIDKNYWYIYRRKDAELQWRGEEDGLPPIGTVCEFVYDSALGSKEWHSALSDGAEVTIIAHFETNDTKLAAFTFYVEEHKYDQVEQADASCFRPIGCKNQQKIENIRKLIGWKKPQLGICPVEELYNRGYINEHETDMSNWRNWKVGDKIEMINAAAWGSMTNGKLYTIEQCSGDNVFAVKGDHSELYEFAEYLMDDSDSPELDFKWHSRPTK